MARGTLKSQYNYKAGMGSNAALHFEHGDS